MVDRTARDLARNAIKAYIRGEITNDDFADQFPQRPLDDPALLAIDTMLGNTQADLHVHKYDQSDPEVSDLYHRCLLFLGTELEYEWPQKNMVGLGSAPTLLELLSLGLIDRSAKRHARFVRAMDEAGDFSVWPFITRADYELARAAERSENAQS